MDSSGRFQAHSLATEINYLKATATAVSRSRTFGYLCCFQILLHLVLQDFDLLKLVLRMMLSCSWQALEETNARHGELQSDIAETSSVMTMLSDLPNKIKHPIMVSR